MINQDYSNMLYGLSRPSLIQVCFECEGIELRKDERGLIQHIYKVLMDMKLPEKREVSLSLDSELKCFYKQRFLRIR